MIGGTQKHVRRVALDDFFVSVRREWKVEEGQEGTRDGVGRPLTEATTWFLSRRSRVTGSGVTNQIRVDRKPSLLPRRGEADREGGRVSGLE